MWKVLAFAAEEWERGKKETRRKREKKEYPTGGALPIPVNA